MASQFDKVIKKLNFKGIKLNICTKKTFPKKLDYEFVPYEQQHVEKPKCEGRVKQATSDTSEKDVTYQAPQNSQNQFDNNIIAFRTIYNQLSNANLKNQTVDLKQRSLNSTGEEEFVPIYENNVFANEDYSASISSPLQSSLVSQSTSKCSCFNECSCMDSNCEFKDSMCQDNNESYFDIDNERLYVCCKAFKAKMDGDLSLRFTDRIKLIHQNNDIALVKNILNGKCGYVPRDCITTISDFLSEIQYFN